MNIGENRRVKRFKHFKKVLSSFFVTVLLLSSVAPATAVERLPSSRGEAASKIKKLKRDLIAAKGQKRAKIIKKIAEIENKVLEHKVQAFR